MKKISTVESKQSKNFRAQKLTIGLDLGDRWSWYCVLDEAGDVLLEQKLGTTPKAMKEVVGKMPQSDCLETGIHSRHRSVRVGIRVRLHPMHADKGNVNSRFGRLKAVSIGLVLIAVGVLRMLGGVQAVTHWTGQPMFSWGLVAAGVVCILSALVPVSWITTAAGIPVGRGKSNTHSR